MAPRGRPRLDAHEHDDDLGLAAARRLMKRFPKWELDICTKCKTWCVIMPEYHGKHPLCWWEDRQVVKTTRRKKEADPNQQQLAV